MLAAVKGVIRGNKVVIENEDMQDYEGAEVIVTFLNDPNVPKRAEEIDWDGFVKSSERGKDVEGYMREMRKRDRL